MTNRIVFESDTPLGVLSLMAAAAAPHVLRAQFKPPVQQATTGNLALATDPERVADKPAPVDTTAQQTQAAEAIGEVRKPRANRKTKQPEATAPATTEQKTIVNVEGPDGQMRHYETLSEAMEGMVDLLDLCTTGDEVKAWVKKNEGLIRDAGNAGKAFADIAGEYVADLEKAAGAKDDTMPKGDEVGGKPKAAEQPPEMDLEVPAHLKRDKLTDIAQPTVGDARTAFLAYCEVNGAPAGRKLLDKYQAPKVSELKADQLGPFIAECAKAKK